jgi:protein-S-isoprenylcysteine O-methyltransferase Ste14
MPGSIPNTSPTIGYICFGLMIVLIAAGFISGKAGFSAAGAAALFLPVFAQFAGAMFFLEGRSVADLWVYRFSRHPQYLGWILPSVGFVTRDGPGGFRPACPGFSR